MYTDVSKLWLLHKIVFDAAVTCEDMSIKRISKHENHLLKVPTDGQSIRTSVENLMLRDNQEKKHTRENQCHSVRAQINQTNHKASVS